MALLTVETIGRTGLKPTLVSAAAGGDKFTNTGREFLYIDNADASPVTITLDITSTVDGAAVVDPTVVVPAGEFRLIGPFPKSYEDSNGAVNFTNSDNTALTVAAIKL